MILNRFNNIWFNYIIEYTKMLSYILDLVFGKEEFDTLDIDMHKLRQTNDLDTSIRISEEIYRQWTLSTDFNVDNIYAFCNEYIQYTTNPRYRISSDYKNLLVYQEMVKDYFETQPTNIPPKIMRNLQFIYWPLYITQIIQYNIHMSNLSKVAIIHDAVANVKYISNLYSFDLEYKLFQVAFLEKLRDSKFPYDH